jgi:hypothetical protein
LKIAVKFILRILLTIVALPILAAVAGLILAPTVLHPFRRILTAEQVRKADEVFTRVGAMREEFAVRAPDGALLRGWKVRAARPNGKLGFAPAWQVAQPVCHAAARGVSAVGGLQRGNDGRATSW